MTGPKGWLWPEAGCVSLRADSSSCIHNCTIINDIDYNRAVRLLDRLYQHVIVCYNDTCLYLIRSVGMDYTTEQLETNAASLRELPDIEKRKRQHNKKRL